MDELKKKLLETGLSEEEAQSFMKASKIFDEYSRLVTTELLTLITKTGQKKADLAITALLFSLSDFVYLTKMDAKTIGPLFEQFHAAMNKSVDEDLKDLLNATPSKQTKTTLN